MKNENGEHKRYSSYFILGGIVSILTGGFIIYKTNQEDEKVDTTSTIYTSTNISYKTHPLEKLKLKLEPYLTNDQILTLISEMNLIKADIIKHKELNKNIICKIIGLQKELADCIYSVRNKQYILDKRKTLLENNLNSYEEMCKNYFNLYTFCLELSKNIVRKFIKFDLKKFQKLVDLFSDDNDFYRSINFYKNLFGNLNCIYSKDNIDDEKKIYLHNLFMMLQSYMQNEIIKVEKWSSSFTDKDKVPDTIYQEKLNFAFHLSCDYFYNMYKVSINELKFILFTHFNLDKTDESTSNCLETVNASELVILGYH